MIYDFTARNVNGMLVQLCEHFREHELPIENSRNGRVVRFPAPVALTYTHPWERVLFSAVRDANPFFHLLESIWMLAGRRDVAFLNIYNSRMAQFSDDGRFFNAAYGARARSHFGVDQLAAVVEYLRDNPNGRQGVVQLWCPRDLGKETKDKACNTQMLFSIVDGAISMTVFNRSNDAILGALGANVVHMSFFQQFVADSLGRPMGGYYQISNNLHFYIDQEKTQKVLSDQTDLCSADVYSRNSFLSGSALERPLFDYGEHSLFLEECSLFCHIVVNLSASRELLNPNIFKNRFIREVCVPMHNSFFSRDDEWLSMIDAPDWRLAAREWIERRTKKEA